MLYIRCVLPIEKYSNSATAQNITRDRSLHSIMISYLNPSRVIHYGPYTHNKCNTTCIMIEHSLWLLCNLHVSIGYIPPHYWHRYFTPLGCRCFKNLQWQITQSKKHAYWGLLGYANAPVGELFLPFWRIIFKAKQSKRNDIHPMKQHQIPDKSSLQQHCCQNTKLSAENIKFDKKKIHKISL